MNFRSLTDLVAMTRKGVHDLPRDFDLVVGIPRSGLLPATMIALLTNKPLIDFEGFLAGRMPTSGFTRKVEINFTEMGQVKRILIVDDSVRSGRNLHDVRRRLAEIRPDVAPIFCAAIADAESNALVDYHFDLCPLPRVFEWNLFNSPFCELTCFDLDGIFCTDPTDDQNDDGPAYLHFLRNVAPINRPGRKLRRIVTSRLERYRPETEQWLSRAGICYDKLDMLDGVTAQERRECGMHPLFKAKIYAGDPNAALFVESDPEQAVKIARMSGKPVLDFTNMKLAHPTALSLPRLKEQSRQYEASIKRWARRILRRAVPARVAREGS